MRECVEMKMTCDGQWVIAMGMERSEIACDTNLLELLNGTLVDTTALVDQVAGL